MNNSVILIKINQLEAQCIEKALYIAEMKKRGFQCPGPQAELKDMILTMMNYTKTYCGTIEKPNYETLAQQKQRLILNQ
jgi:hypothetical protein